MGIKDLQTFLRKQFPSCLVDLNAADYSVSGHVFGDPVLVSHIFSDLFLRIHSVRDPNLTTRRLYEHLVEPIRKFASVCAKREHQMPCYYFIVADKQEFVPSAKAKEQKRRRDIYFTTPSEEGSIPEVFKSDDVVCDEGVCVKVEFTDSKDVPQTIWTPFTFDTTQLMYSDKAIQRQLFNYIYNRLLQEEEFPEGFHVVCDMWPDSAPKIISYFGGETLPSQEDFKTTVSEIGEGEMGIVHHLLREQSERRLTNDFCAILDTKDGDVFPISVTMLWDTDQRVAWISNGSNGTGFDVTRLISNFKQLGIPAQQVAATCAVAGNDYVPKSLLSHQMGAEHVFAMMTVPLHQISWIPTKKSAVELFICEMYRYYCRRSEKIHDIPETILTLTDLRRHFSSAKCYKKFKIPKFEEEDNAVNKLFFLFAYWGSGIQLRDLYVDTPTNPATSQQKRQRQKTPANSVKQVKPRTKKFK